MLSVRPLLLSRSSSVVLILFIALDRSALQPTSHSFWIDASRSFSLLARFFLERLRSAVLGTDGKLIASRASLSKQLLSSGVSERTRRDNLKQRTRLRLDSKNSWQRRRTTQTRNRAP